MSLVTRLAARPQGVTVADLMAVMCCPMRDAVARLRAAQDKGLVVRTGGGPKEAFRWVAK